MKKTKLLAIAFMLIISACQEITRVDEPAKYVDPFIGTDGHGHTYPGAATPFGMVQLSPQTRLDGWDGCSGYHYTDSLLYGFAHTALNGTGVSDYGDILVMPGIGKPSITNTDYRSPFKKENEHAEAGYYKVYLHEPSITAEMTATTRVGHHKYTFHNPDQVHFIIDLDHRDRVLDSWIEQVSETEVRGMRRSSNWAEDMLWYFHMEFSKPIENFEIAIDNQFVTGESQGRGTNVKAVAHFNASSNEAIEVKVALSAVDSYGALKNLKAELPEWGFDQTRQKAYDAWNKELSKIIVSGDSPEQKTVFYTALYRTFLQPNTFMDVDNRYRGMDKNIHVADGFTNYTVFSLWDTYRTWHPLMTILEQERSIDFMKVMLDMYEKGGLLPIWELAANETYCMIGNHSISVIADAYMKGIRGFDYEKAMDAMIHSATRDHFGLDVYRKHGFIPGEKEHESISKTLEYAYNDWCIALMAKELGRYDVYQEYIKRAQYYKNIFDPQTGFMRPRINGSWLTPFDPTTVDWHFTEANSWHYSFYVPQDITGFYKLHGGKENLANKIDELFETTDPITGRDMKDITGLIGQYAQGNEPSHHMAYLYNFVNQPWKTQQRVRQIMDELYTHKPDGLSGNEDCGQMSAWLVMSAMGFYPVSPGLPVYTIGTPWFPEMEINLENGNTFKITAKGVSKRNIYIQSATLNGEVYEKSYLNHSDIMNGGHLEFRMGSKPNKSWGSADGNIPVTSIEDYLILPVPFFVAETAVVREPIFVEINTIVDGCKIFYTLDGSVPTKESAQYLEPLIVDDTKTITAVAWKDGFGYSKPVQASFVKIDINRNIEIVPPLDANYHGGGPEALIDGLRGAHNFRLGGWHGYWGLDFEATVDIGEVQPINYLAAGFLQEIRSWIWMPKDVAFYVSSDGQNFTKVLHVENKVAIDDYTEQVHDLGGRVNTRGRYVKVKANNFGKIPNWHLGASGEAWLFIDEIIIE